MIQSPCGRSVAAVAGVVEVIYSFVYPGGLCSHGLTVPTLLRAEQGDSVYLTNDVILYLFVQCVIVCYLCYCKEDTDRFGGSVRSLIERLCMEVH